MEIQKDGDDGLRGENGGLKMNHDEFSILPKKSRIITKWSLRAVFPINKRVTLIIEGILLPEKIAWKSSPIQKVINKRTIYTFSCSVYELEGEMNVKQSMENGFSDAFVSYLKDGFPEHWEYVLYNRIEKTTTQESKLLQAKIKEIQEHKKNKQQQINTTFPPNHAKLNQPNIIPSDEMVSQPAFNYLHDMNTLPSFPVANEDPSYMYSLMRPDNYLNNDLNDFTTGHFLHDTHFGSPYHDLNLNTDHLPDSVEFQQKTFPPSSQHFTDPTTGIVDISNLIIQPSSITMIPNQDLPPTDVPTEPVLPVKKTKKRGRKPATQTTAVRRSQRQVKKVYTEEVLSGRAPTRKRGGKRTVHQATEGTTRKRGRKARAKVNEEEKEETYSLDSDKKSAEETEESKTKKKTPVNKLAKKGSLKRREQLRQLVAENDDYLANKIQEENPNQLFEENSTVFPTDPKLDFHELRITNQSHKEQIDSSYSISDNDDTNFESMKPREMDRFMIDEQRGSRRKKMSLQYVPKVNSVKNINVMEDNDRSIIRASMTPSGESRIEIEDKDEGIFHLSENEVNNTDDSDL